MAYSAFGGDLAGFVGTYRYASINAHRGDLQVWRGERQRDGGRERPRERLAESERGGEREAGREGAREIERAREIEK